MNDTQKIYNLEFWLLCLSNFLFSASFSMIIPELPDYLASLGGREYIGYIISLFTLAAAISRPFSGKLTDKIGRVPIMAFGSVVCFILGGLYPAVHTVGGFLLLRFFHGFSTGTKPTATAAYVADLIPSQRRGEAQGMLGIFTATGMSIGPALGGFMANQFGINPMFYSSSVAALLSIAILLSLKESLPEKKRKKFSFKYFRIGLNDILEPRVIHIFWIFLLMTFSSGVIHTIIPDASKVAGWTNKGLYFSIYTIASILIRFSFSKLSDQKGRIPVLKYSMVLLFISMVILAWKINTSTIIISAICFGFSYGFNTPTISAWANDLGHKYRMGRAMSTVYMALEIGIGLGALFTGWVYQGNMDNIKYPFALSAFLIILTFIYLNILQKRGDNGFFRISN